jgi:hypothetical protein
MTDDFAPLVHRQPHVGGFRDEIADGQHQTLSIDDNAIADAFGSQNARREGILGDDRA